MITIFYNCCSYARCVSVPLSVFTSDPQAEPGHHDRLSKGSVPLHAAQPLPLVAAGVELKAVIVLVLPEQSSADDYPEVCSVERIVKGVHNITTWKYRR